MKRFPLVVLLLVLLLPGCMAPGDVRLDEAAQSNILTQNQLIQSFDVDAMAEADVRAAMKEQQRWMQILATLVERLKAL